MESYHEDDFVRSLAISSNLGLKSLMFEGIGPIINFFGDNRACSVGYLDQLLKEIVTSIN